MYNYRGISKNTVELLQLNKFNDSKSFYEQHKEELKQGATVPMRQIVLDLSGILSEIDPLIDTDPKYLVSRIRRDTRRTKNKMLYRDNLWVMLRRNKFSYPFAPFYWFEFSPEGYGYGLAMWSSKQNLLDYVRLKIANEPEKWLKLVELAKKNGLIYSVDDFYKKDKIKNIPDYLKIYTNAKNYAFIKWSNNLKKIGSPKIVAELKNVIKNTAPLYKFLSQAYDEAYKKGEVDLEYYKR